MRINKYKGCLAMQQGSPENIILTDFGQIWLRRSHIIQVTFDEGISINYHHIRALLLIMKQLSVHNTKPIVVDFRPAQKISREARLTLMGERAVEAKESMAFIVKSPTVKLLINLSLFFLRPSFPAHCFLSEERALQWTEKLRSYPHLTLASERGQAISA